MTVCPRCGACAVKVDWNHPPWSGSLTCLACNYVGPVKSNAEPIYKRRDGETRNDK